MLSKIILITRGSKGDIYPFLQIGNTFKAKKHRVTILSDSIYREDVLEKGFDFMALDVNSSRSLNAMPEYYHNLPSLLELYKDFIIPNIQKEVEIIESISVNNAAVVLAHGNYYLSSLFAMEKLKIPLYLCVLSPSFMHSFQLFEGIVKSLSKEINEVRASVGLMPVSDWRQWLNSYKQCFAFWPDWFSGSSYNFTSKVNYVGFLSIDNLENGCLSKDVDSFIGRESQKILITHGTSLPFNELFFHVCIDTCRDLEADLIITTPFRKLLPDILPENVIWVEFCPFHKLLPYIDLIIHHGGVGTVRESIKNAVPQLIVGQGFDRQHNGRIVSELGLGDWISPKVFSREVLFHKVSNILCNDEMQSICNRYESILKTQATLDALYNSLTEDKSYVEI